MPSFRFRGFTDASTVALTLGQGAQSADANLVWAQALTTPTASFEIARWDGNTDAELVAPVAVAFTPTNITGFVGVDGEPIAEPAGDTNVYDPTALEIFWSWDFGDPGYVPLVRPNVADTMRDLNRAYVKRPWHVMHAPGNKTVTLYGYDTRGNWGTATFTFGLNGDSPAIADPDTHFTGREVYFSMEGIFPAGVPLADRCTAVNQTNNRLNAVRVAGQMVRLRLRRGEVYTFLAEIGGGNIYIDSYGDPADPPPKHVIGSTLMPNQDGPFSLSNSANGFPRVIDIDVEGPYDAATETGRRCTALLSTTSLNGKRHFYHRCRISGFRSFSLTLQPDSTRVISDCDITNWQDYGIYAGDGLRLTLAILGGDIHQKSDALGGTDHGTSNSNFANLTNRHGPIRHNSVRDLYVVGSSFFSRNGWSQRSGAGVGDTAPSTLAQAAYRFGATLTPDVRNYSAWERCSFEGGAGSIHFVDLGFDGIENTTNYQANVLIESCLMVASRDTESFVQGKGAGMSARNNYLVVPAVPHVGGPRYPQMIPWDFVGAPDQARPSRVTVFNNTGYILATDAQLGGTTARVMGSYSADHNPLVENNVLYGPGLDPALGRDLEPFTTPAPALDGFTSRFLGTRFNFPPIGHQSLGPFVTAESVRELSPGGTTPVADGEWISVPYPDYTGKNNGALGQVTRSMVDSLLPSGAVRYHQVSLWQHNVKAAAAAAAGGDGRVAFAFTDTHIRVQNLSGIAWTSNIWILLDLSDRLMDFVPGTGNPATIPMLVPATTTGATSSGLWAPNDMVGAQRTLPAMPGAFAPVT